MREKEYWAGLKQTTYILMLVVVASIGLNIYQGISLVKIAKSREIPLMIPPNIVQDVGSITYKLLYGEYYIGLVSTFTSDQYNQYVNEILTNSHPDFSREIEKSLNESSFEIIDNNVKQSYYIDKSTLRIDKLKEVATWRISASGIFDREYAGIKKRENKYSFYVDIFYVNGRCFIKRWGHGKGKI